MSILQPILSDENIIDITNYLNLYRERNQAPPLCWDATIATFSQKWSYYMASNNLFQHSGSLLYGENIIYLNKYGEDPVTLIKLAIDSWYNEILLYDFNTPGFSDATGHFTSLVWVSTTTFGIGISINETTGEAFISLNTYPAGNILGEFQLNVLQPIAIEPIPIPEPIPPMTTNKQVVLEQLSAIINQVDEGCNQTYIRDNITTIISEIQHSSSF